MPRTRRVSMDQWASRVTAWQRSGRTATVFAAERGWDAAQLRWWRWKLERDGAIPARASRSAAPREPAGSNARPTFLRLVSRDDEQPAADTTPTCVELVLRGGRVLRFDDAIDPGRLRALVEALEVRA